MNRNFAVHLILVFTVFFCQGPLVHASVDSGHYEVAVIDIKGDVEVDSKADGTWIRPLIGMKLMKRAVIKTGKDSSIDVVFDSEGLNVLKIKGDTLITVHEAKIELKNGSVMASFANLAPGTSFTVKTPTAVCGIRGSGMGVDHINDMTVVMAYEHSVYVQGVDGDGNPLGQEVVIPEGWKTQVLANGDITLPEELSENEREIFEAWVALVTGESVPGEDDKVGDDEDSVNKDLQDVKNEEKPDISPDGEDPSGCGSDFDSGYSFSRE